MTIKINSINKNLWKDKTLYYIIRILTRTIYFPAVNPYTAKKQYNSYQTKQQDQEPILERPYWLNFPTTGILR